jgi:Antitoxin Xre-like helix-turn-helix domain/Antitoxin Xre/MbcA/ParS C-terminal toxin-binding domain
MVHKPKARLHGAADASKVVTKAALRAADRLEIKNNVLAKIIGLSAPTISRMYKGAYLLPSESKAFELAVLFVRFYRALDGIVGGDDSVAADWLKNKNTVLNGIPLEMIQSVSGLTNAIEYLDSRRAIV